MIQFIVDWLDDVPTILTGPTIVWGLVEFDLAEDLVTVRAAGCVEGTQVGGAMPRVLAKTLIRELWRAEHQHIGVS